MEAIIKVRADYCSNCNKPRSVECYDKFDKPINLTYELDQLERGKEINLDNRVLSYMKCSRCGFIYCIDFRNPNIIKPLRSFSIIQSFLDTNYK